MKQHQTSPARAAMKLLCVLLGIVFFLLLGITLSFRSWFSALGSSVPAGAFLTAQELGGGTPGADGVVFESHDLTIGGRGSGITNILLIGQDRREGESVARSDTMILCTFNPDAKKITLTSFLRDLYVQIPGHNNNRINAAYAAGGAPLLAKTLETNFGIQLDGCVEVDFSQFADIVDLLDGVTIELRRDEAQLISRETGTQLEEGLQTLNGAQALTYSRIRKLDADGDFSRTQRQRKVLQAMADRFRDASLTTLLTLTEALLPMISTDMSAGKILRCTMELFPLLSDSQLVSQSIPAPGSCSDRTIAGMSVLVADMEAVRQALADSLLP